MKELIYVTGNPVKLQQAAAACEPHGIALRQIQLDIQEIQSETGEAIARDKAQRAFTALNRPLAVSDDSWMIPGLNSFPGPYMKYINDWFSSEDWLRLTKDLTDRSIILRQIVIYQDNDGQQLFTADIQGTLLREIRGTSLYPHAAITSFDGGKTSNAEYHQKGQSASQYYHNPWHDFVEWYAKDAYKTATR